MIYLLKLQDTYLYNSILTVKNLKDISQIQFDDG